jgi:hypothetical protein
VIVQNKISQIASVDLECRVHSAAIAPVQQKAVANTNRQNQRMPKAAPTRKHKHVSASHPWEHPLGHEERPMVIKKLLVVFNPAV